MKMKQTNIVYTCHHDACHDCVLSHEQTFSGVCYLVVSEVPSVLVVTKQ